MPQVVACLSERGYGIDKASMSDAEVVALKRELTVTPLSTSSVVMTTQPTSIPLYLESSKKLYIPKHFGLKKYGVAQTCKYPEEDKLTAKFQGSLRPEQIGPVENFLKAARDPSEAGGIINLACAAGKTVLSIYIIAELGVKTMVVVHKDFLLEQWRERINTFMPSARVGLLKAKTVDVKDKDIVIASLQSLSMKEYAADIFHGFGFLIVDEVHRTGTEVFSQAFKKLSTRYTLGLSATITRKDGLTKVFKWYLGEVVNKNKRKKENVYVEVVKFWASDPRYSKEETLGYNKLNFSKMISNICAYQPRTDLIVEKIIEYMRDPKAVDKRRKILVLSDRKNHLASIKHSLEAKAPHITTGFYVGGMKPQQLEDSTTKDVILSTVAFVQEGLDIRDLDTLVFTTPKSSIEQCVGRILRAKEDERANLPIVLDIVDQFSIFERQAAKRYTFYRICGFTVSSVDEPAARPDTVSPGLFLED